MNQFHAVAIDRRENQILGVLPAADLVTAQRGARLLAKCGQSSTVLVTSRALRALAVIDAGEAVETSPGNFEIAADQPRSDQP